MDYVTILGFVASALGIISFLPQVIKTWKSKSTKDISLGMYALLCGGTILWTIYGIFINSLPVIVVNIVIFILSLILLIFKLKYK